MSHIPVLLNEVLEYLDASKGTKFIDGTVGDGGYLSAILELNPKAKVLGIDLDQTTLDKLSKGIVSAYAQGYGGSAEALAKSGQSSLGQRVELAYGNFADLRKLAVEHSFYEADGIILDLGLSSSQLDNPERGLSFQTNGPLDMRFDPTASLTGIEVVNKYPAEKLQKIFREFGEERFSKRIVKRIVDVRQNSRIGTTGQLVHLILDVLPKSVKHKAPEVARRIFQAIRIEVNQELENLKKVLPQTIELLKPGGRLVVISFHSLEDRMVKHFMREQKELDKVGILTKKPIRASRQEQTENPRSRPAKLRAIEKL